VFCVCVELAQRTGLTYEIVQNWFINARMRRWKPLIKAKKAAEASGVTFDLSSAIKLTNQPQALKVKKSSANNSINTDSEDNNRSDEDPKNFRPPFSPDSSNDHKNSTHSMPSLLDASLEFFNQHNNQANTNSSNNSLPHLQSPGIKRKREPVESAENIAESSLDYLSSSSARGNSRLSANSVHHLRRWFTEHINNPYPNNDQKNKLCAETGLSLGQVNNFFTNARARFWQPFLRKISQTSELKPEQIIANSNAANNNNNNNTVPSSVNNPLAGANLVDLSDKLSLSERAGLLILASNLSAQEEFAKACEKYVKAANA
jgi:hypothetical protein